MKASQGVLIECDPAIRAIIMNIESKSSTKFVLEELDDTHLLVSGKVLGQLKSELDRVLADTRFNESDEDGGSASD